MIDITEALKTLRPRAEWVIRGDELEWLDAIQSEPTQAEIDAEITRLQTEYDAQSYARSRKQEYDKLPQFEMQFDDNRDGTTTWVDSINEIKSQFPKG